MTAILEVKELVKKYGDFTAVDGVSFEVQEGEIFSLLGPNGAGKTTTISVLSTLYTATSGEAAIAGHSLGREPMAVRRVIGVVPQELALYEDLSARENLNFWGQMYGLSGRILKARVDEVLEQIGLAERAKERVKTYSGGMKRRVNIGVGLLHKPRLLFMDEPTVGIDPQSRRAILDSVKDLNRQGMTVLYTTHYMEEAQALCDRLAIIDHGRLIATGTLDELRRMMGERDLVRLAGVFDPPRAQAVAQRLDGAEVVSVDAGLLILAVEGASRKLPAIFSALAAIGAEVRETTIAQPSLETLFIKLTGRELRE
jgi:ABC-2 type transport system ATP-binding protein